MRPLTLSLIFLAVGCAHSRQSHDDFDDAPRPKRAASSTLPPAAAAPPTSFVVTAEGDDGFEETRPVSTKTASTTASVSEARDYDSPKVRATDFDAPPEKPLATIRDVTPPREEPKGRGVPIIVERPTGTSDGFPEVRPRQPTESRRPVETAEADEPERTPAREAGQAAMMGRAVESGRAPITPAPEPDRTATIAEEAKARLDRDIAAINGETKDPAREPARATPPPSKRAKTAEKREQEKEKEPAFDQDLESSRFGLSILVGAGANLSSNSRGGFTTALAYGGTIAWNPSFAGPFGLDLSFFRSANTSKASSFNVAQDFNHFAVRLLVTKNFSKYFFSGFGGGFLLTKTSASYSVNGVDQDAIISATSRPGIDGTIVAGIRAGYFETRLDLRALGRGMTRLDFLPTLSLGATF